MPWDPSLHYIAPGNNGDDDGDDDDAPGKNGDHIMIIIISPIQHIWGGRPSASRQSRN